MEEDEELQRFLKERVRTIVEGIQEGVRREVQRLREMNLPVYVVVVRDGRVVDITREPPTDDDAQHRK